MASPRRSKTSGASWRDVTVSPFILVQGGEDYIHTRVTDTIKSKLKQAEPDTEIHHLPVAEYQEGELQVLASPSLFGEKMLMVFDDIFIITDTLFFCCVT